MGENTALSIEKTVIWKMENLSWIHRGNVYKTHIGFGLGAAKTF